MNRIRSLIAMARRRMFIEVWLAESLKASAVAALFLLLLVVERRTTGFTSRLGLPSGWDGVWVWVGVTVGLFTLAKGWAAWRAFRAARKPASVVLELDARLGTGERFTTALELEHDDDPFARAAVADAIRLAEGADLPARLRERFAIKPPPRWWIAPTVSVVALTLWLVLPQLTGGLGTPGKDIRLVGGEQASSHTPEEERLQQLLDAIRESPDLAAALQQEIDRAQEQLAERPEHRAPEEHAREALRRMAELQQRLDDIRGREETQATLALKDALAGLDLPEESNAAADLAEALKRGDFTAAKQALEALQEAMKNGDLTEEQRAALAEALEQTAQQLEALAQNPQALAQALGAAGLDPQLAQNPQALKEALEQSASLNQSQKEALQKLAGAMQQSQGKLSKMSQQLSQMSSECNNGGQEGQQGQQGEQSSDGGMRGAEELGQMLSEAEADAAMLAACQNAASQCSNPGGQKDDGTCQVASRSGQGPDAAGGSKAGTGGTTGKTKDPKEHNLATRTDQQAGDKRGNDVIARQLVEGQSPVGESHARLQELAREIALRAERSIDEEPMPAHLREVEKKYFGKVGRMLERKGVKPTAPASPSGDAPATAPGNAK